MNFLCQNFVALPTKVLYSYSVYIALCLISSLTYYTILCISHKHIHILTVGISATVLRGTCMLKHQLTQGYVLILEDMFTFTGHPKYKQISSQSLAHLSSVAGFIQWCVVGWDQLLATAGGRHQ